MKKQPDVSDRLGKINNKYCLRDNPTIIKYSVYECKVFTAILYKTKEN